jgi:hypothetical protein
MYVYIKWLVLQKNVYDRTIYLLNERMWGLMRMKWREQRRRSTRNTPLQNQSYTRARWLIHPWFIHSQAFLHRIVLERTIYECMINSQWASHHSEANSTYLHWRPTTIRQMDETPEPQFPTRLWKTSRVLSAVSAPRPGNTWLNIVSTTRKVKAYLLRCTVRVTAWSR